MEVLNRVCRDIWSYRYAVAGIILYFLMGTFIIDQFCPLVYFVGIPCPACGLTRAGLCVVTGQFQEAFYMNAMIYPVLLLGIAFVIQRYGRGKSVKVLTYYLLVVLIIGICYYIYRMIRYFPTQEPMLFWKDSVMGKFLRLKY